MNADAILRFWFSWEPRSDTGEVLMSYRIDRMVTDLVCWGDVICKCRALATGMLQQPRALPNLNLPDPSGHPMELIVEWADEHEINLHLEYIGDRSLAWATASDRLQVFADHIEKNEDLNEVTHVSPQPGALALIKGGLSSTG